MTALRVRLWFWQLITRLSCFSQFFFFYKIKNFFHLWVNLYMITDTYVHVPPPFNSPFFMTPPFPAVSKSCDPPSVSTPLPLLISDKSLIAHQCCDQLTAVKTGHPLTSTTWPYRGLKCRPIEVEYFWSYPLINYQFQMIAGSSLFSPCLMRKRV